MTLDGLIFVFVTVTGACVGSFLNVVIYRLPAGKSLAHPPSHCPKCGTPLAWYDNVPILGWLWLRARCRHCRAPISLQYPVIEACTAVLFALIFWGCYWSGYRPTMVNQYFGLEQTWPVLAVYLVTAACLLAATVIDARLFIIPLSIPWLVMFIAIVALPVAAGFEAVTQFASPRPESWANAWEQVTGPTVAGPPRTGWATGAAWGGLVGWLIATALVRLGVLPMSFPMTEEEQARERQRVAEQAELEEKKKRQTKKQREEHEAAFFVRMRQHAVWLAVLAVVAVVLFLEGGLFGQIAAVAVFCWGIIMHGAQLDEPEIVEEPGEWLNYPNPRREALKELAHLIFPIAGFTLGAVLMWNSVGPTSLQSGPAAAWHVATGVVLGIVVGGGLIWITRVAGTLLFGKEAMGMGDVPLMACIGGVLGANETVVIFFMAPFFALVHTLLIVGLGQIFKQRFRPIPYGPHLCGAAIIVMIFHAPIAAIIIQIVGLNPFPN